jgi:fructose-bisphosphate aldolase class II
MITDTKTLLKTAHHRFAIGAYNICCLEQFMGLFEGCAASQAPFLLALTDVALYHSHPTMLKAMIQGVGEIFPDTVFAVHHDHGDEESCYRASRAVFFHPL